MMVCAMMLLLVGLMVARRAAVVIDTKKIGVTTSSVVRRRAPVLRDSRGERGGRLAVLAAGDRARLPLSLHQVHLAALDLVVDRGQALRILV